MAVGNSWTYNITTDGDSGTTINKMTAVTSAVLVTERISIVGVTASIAVKTWLAPGAGPVKEQVVTDEGSATTIAANEELVSFTKG